ncbi:dihydrolipoamide acetyltransferase family protein [Phytohabitans sp. ZYX-F-186]|uniref:Dihydrolipoamide acetyltransferase component of pyruvate dehydrogenase complex n=1 Tax=Phytohabitans maris TaxID=3071409 RepID=A0ABU0ZTE1_9ACTN|nr:dihydrolipoamide acetyltransferase family protein [Phytohabitans sp. ZYX-F-186]MDQ7910305.1 dihydrolipoamide acetyltransferase family protein [Phytohabitans sp. ZYX-F-186]
MSRIKEFPLPDLAEGLVEGEIIKWLVAVGDTIELNQPIVEVETAKAAVEIPAKWAGKVHAIHFEEGATVEVGTPIISIDTDPDAGEPAEAERTPVLVGYGPRTAAASRRPRKTNGSTTAVAPPPSPVAPPPPPPPVAPPAPAPEVLAKPNVLAKPPVRKLARDLGVDLGSLTGTGPEGSITRDDVQAAVSAPPSPAFVGREQRIPVKGVRKLTAENMVSSAFTAPHVTEFLTVDMTRSVKALDRLRALPEWREVRISPLLIVAKAVLVAIGRHPLINSTWAGDEIVVKQYVNLGIAAATDRGLIVPNIKDAERLSLRELADAMTELVQTAKSGRTAPADMTGGTFTITNVGIYGVDTGTPILPPGESAILALGTVKEAPWVHKGKIRVRQVTTLGLSFDHRIIDGELGSKFLRDVGAFLTDPEASLLAWT